MCLLAEMLGGRCPTMIGPARKFFWSDYQNILHISWDYNTSSIRYPSITKSQDGGRKQYGAW